MVLISERIQTSALIARPLVLVGAISLLALLLAGQIEGTSATSSSSPESTQLALWARDGGFGESWLIRVLRELFADINWQAIEDAREEVEKFVRKVDRLIKSFRNNEKQSSPTTTTTTSTTPMSQTSQSDEQAYDFPREARLIQGKWWSSGPKSAAAAMPAALAGELGDASDVKAMLERVACFLGYMRILTNTNEALAELDAAKVVSSLFGAGSPSASSGGGYFKKWFG